MSEMIKAVCAAAASGTGTKMTIESFQKREDAIFTSHLSAIELDTQVKYNSCTKNKHNLPSIYMKISIIIARSHKSRAAVDYTPISVQPHGPTRGVWPIATVANDSQLHLVASSI